MSGLTIHRDHRPLLLNGARASSPWTTRRELADWRAWAAAAAHRAPHIPGPVRVTVTHHRPSARSMPDVGACMLPAKACIDGLVDAHVLTDDDPTVVAELVFIAPVISGRHGLTIQVDPIEATA